MEGVIEVLGVGRKGLNSVENLVMCTDFRGGIM